MDYIRFNNCDDECSREGCPYRGISTCEMCDGD